MERASASALCCVFCLGGPHITRLSGGLGEAADWGNEQDGRAEKTLPSPHCPAFPTSPLALAGARLTAEAGQAASACDGVSPSVQGRTLLSRLFDRLFPKGMVWGADRRCLGAAGRESKAPPYPPPFPPAFS